MEKIKSNHLKCRNLPYDYEIIDRIDSKPVIGLATLAIVGFSALSSQYFMLGAVIVFFSFYGLINMKNNTLVVFTDAFVIFYLDDKKEDCYLIYWDEILDYRYITKPFETDMIEITLIDGKKVQFKSLSRPILMRNFKKYVRRNELDNDD